MAQDSQENKHIVLMAFGLPLMTSVIVAASMYAGHVLTTRSDRPTNVTVSAQAPRIDVNVPQAVPPTIQVASALPAITVQVPQSPPANVTVNTPQAAPPNITISPATPTVTVIQREVGTGRQTPIAADEPKLNDLQSAALTIEKSSGAPANSAEGSRRNMTVPIIEALALNELNNKDSAGVRTQVPAQPTLDTLYQLATSYIDSYCKKQGLDPIAENRKWYKKWKSGLDQAVADNIDSGEQSYINRVVIAKRDYFNIERATPERVVEACRLMLRYRDGQLAWLQAMKDAMTADNLRKTVAFLAVGP